MHWYDFDLIIESMFNTTAGTLKKLAAILWYSGIVVLFIKSTSLFLAADRTGADIFLLLPAVCAGFVIGWIKARYLFVRICRKNLNRISKLQKPMLWQFYRIRFYLFLGIMVSLGHYLGRHAQEDHALLILLGVLEFSVATALLLSCHCFWEKD